MTGGVDGPDIPARAVTKTRRPDVRTGTLIRTRLSEILDAAVDSSEPLVLVCAPAGSGKSTAVASWAAERDDVGVSWMQIGAGDNDPIRFWNTIVAGLASINQRIVDVVEPILRTPKAGFVETALPVLINELDGVGRLAIVLDDYHLITNDEIHRAVSELIDALPAHVTIVMSTRFDPPLRIGRLRVRGQLREIRAADLKFDPTEAAAILGGSHLTAAQIESLCLRTEGWAAGLVLAAISLARSTDPAGFVENFAGDNRMVVDYLSSELWDTLPGDARDVFLKMSILDKMCGPLVDELAGTSGQGAEWLESAVHDNQLIIPLDDHGLWYRFHHLLQDLLHAQLERTHTDEIARLHRCAATWFAANDDPEMAIHHALAAGDLDTAAGLVGTHGSNVFSEGRLVTVQDWLGSLGDETIARYPSLAVLRVWTMVVDGDFINIAAPLDVAAEALSNAGDDIDTALLEGSLGAAAAITAIVSGNIDGALSTIKEIVDRPDRYEITALVSGIEGICLTWRGLHHEAIAPLESSAQSAPGVGEHLIASTSLIFLAINACENGDLGRARHMAEEALVNAERHRLGEYHQLALAHSILGRTNHSFDPDAALDHTVRGIVLARRSHEPIMLAYALVAHAETLLSCSLNDMAEAVLAEARNLVNDLVDPGMVLTFLARIEAQFGSGAPMRRAHPGSTLVDELTARELTILRLLPSTLTVREIANELYISHNTVKGHLKAVYRKLGVSERSLAVQRARELSLL